MKPTATQRAATIKRLRETLALLYGPTTPSEEQRDAARALGLEDHLPDPRPDLLKPEPRP
jgi:hypothetical protein